MRNKFLSRIIVVILLSTFLTLSVGRVTRVSAMADPVQSVAPIFDTQIYQLQDYINNGGMTDPQLDIFYWLAGAAAVGQLGAQDAKLESPYVIEHDIHEWLINCGIQLYNTLIGLIPSGDYYVGVDYPTKGLSRDQIKAIVALLMGDAVVARNYNNLDDFLQDNPDEFYIPFTPDIQIGINGVYSLNGGAYDWQIRDLEWDNGNFLWKDSELTGVALQNYNSLVVNMPPAHYLANNTNVSGDPKGIIFSGISLNPFYDLFVNTSDHTISFYNRPSGIVVTDCVYAFNGNPVYKDINSGTCGFQFNVVNYNPNDYSNYVELVMHFLNYIPSSYNDPNMLIKGYVNGYAAYFRYSDFIARVMVGPTWADAQELTPTSDLNFQIDNLNYYTRVGSDYLLDIIGLINDLLNQTDIYDPVFNNLHFPDGNIVHDPILTKVTTEILDLINEINPPIPVNLNDIDEITHVSYLQALKEEATRGGNALADLVAFWHNCDAEIIYLLFGAGITVLIGAFIGKWGHS